MTNEAAGYEAALRQFASDKGLARLARFVRARAGDRCDACGSTLPRLLFGLKDARTERCYFVGQNCLNWLLQAGLVARARFRQTSETAYDLEMRLRHDGDPVAIDADEILVPPVGEAMPRFVGESVSTARPSVEGRWVRQDGALVFEQKQEADLQPIMILIAVGRLSPGRGGWPRDDR
jgi:hypothetical protein